MYIRLLFSSGWTGFSYRQRVYMMLLFIWLLGATFPSTHQSKLKLFFESLQCIFFLGFLAYTFRWGCPPCQFLTSCGIWPSPRGQLSWITLTFQLCSWPLKQLTSRLSFSSSCILSSIFCPPSHLHPHIYYVYSSFLTWIFWPLFLPVMLLEDWKHL